MRGKPSARPSVLLIVGSAVTFICFFDFLRMQLRDSGSLPITLGCVFMCLWAVFPLCAGKRLNRGLRVFFTVTLVAYTGVFIVFCGIVLGYAWTRPEPTVTDDSVLLVLGCHTGEQPSSMLAYRLDAAIGLAEGNSCPIVVSGAQGSNEPRTEASSMAEYLAAHGVDETRIVPEEDASSTRENLRFTEVLLRESGVTAEPLIVVTSDYHVLRAAVNARQLGVEAEVVTVPSKSSAAGVPLPYMLTRELLAYLKLAFTVLRGA